MKYYAMIVVVSVDESKDGITAFDSISDIEPDGADLCYVSDPTKVLPMEGGTFSAVQILDQAVGWS